MRETVAEKAARYLAEGRVRVRECSEVAGTMFAEVQGTGPYAVTVEAGRWRCTCPARTRACCHVQATQRIFGPAA